MKELTVLAVNENVDKVVDFVNEELESKNCSFKILTQIDVAIDEIFANISNYAYGSNTGKAMISVEFDDSGETVYITFTDSGVKYNPLEKEDPDTSLSAEEREIGGLGIFIVKKSMDNITYEYKDNKNILCISKKIL